MNHPLYHDAVNKRREEGKRIIYHYTNVENLFLIIKSMSLKPSEFGKSDDLNEANIANVDRIDDARIRDSLEEFIRKKCLYLSFIQDGDTRKGEVEGTNHPRMWSQYAQKGFGACLAIDEERFLQINEKNLGTFHKFEPVLYGRVNGANIKIEEEYELGIEERLIKKHYHELFFKKHIDWKEEHEIRLFGIDLSQYLSIYGALEFICLGPKFINDKASMSRLIEAISDSSSKFYGYLIPHSFACVTSSSYGYFTHDAFVSAQILERLKQYKQYFDDWCKSYI